MKDLASCAQSQGNILVTWWITCLPGRMSLAHTLSMSRQIRCFFNNTGKGSRFFVSPLPMVTPPAKIKMRY